VKSKLVFWAASCILSAVCLGQWLERSVPVGDTMGTLSGTSGVVFNPRSGNVYVGSSGRTLVFNPATIQKVRSIPHAGMPVFCSAADKVYLMASTVSVIDAAADTFVRLLELPGSITAGRFGYSPRSNRIFSIVNSEPPLVAVLDCSGDSVLDAFLPPALPTALVVDTGADRLFVGVRSSAGKLYAYDCATGSPVGEVQTGLGQTTALAFSPLSRRLYCYGSADTVGAADTLLAVDADSMRVRGPVAGALPPSRTAFNAGLDRIAVVSGGSVQVIDCARDSVIHTRSLGSEAMDVICSPFSGRTYVAVADPDSIFVLNALDSIVNWIPVSETALGRNLLGFSPERNELYCARYLDSVIIVDATADTIKGTLDYSYLVPRQMIHNPAGNKLYLLCPGKDMLLAMSPDYSFRRIPDGVTSNYALPVLNPALNRLYVADNDYLRVIDCNSDSLVRVVATPGISRPTPVFVPGANKLYLFPVSASPDCILAYDCLRDTFYRSIVLNGETPSAVFDPRSNRVFFTCENFPTLRALDPVTDSVVWSLETGLSSSRGRLAVYPELGRLYYSEQRSGVMYTVDVLADSLVGAIGLPWDIDTLLLDRRLGKLFLCSRDAPEVLVFDCRSGSIVDTVLAGFRYSALMNDRNDKLYLRYGAVVDCRYDSVVTMLPPDSLNPRCMAWNQIDNRVYQVAASVLYVYRDDPIGVEQTPNAEVRTPNSGATVIRGVLFLPKSTSTSSSPGWLLDISGRKGLCARLSAKWSEDQIGRRSW